MEIDIWREPMNERSVIFENITKSIEYTKRKCWFVEYKVCKWCFDEMKLNKSKDYVNGLYWRCVNRICGKRETL
jgi:hypothetical protein